MAAMSPTIYGMMIRRLLVNPSFNASNISCRCLSVANSGSSTISNNAVAIRHKHKVPQKRASFLLNMLRTEEFDKLKNGRKWADIRAGDSIEIQQLPYMTATKPETVKGLVIAKVNRASDTAVTIINNEYGTPISRRILLFAPNIINVKILQKAYIHEGKKRVRRSKIYYYMDKDPKLFTIT